MKRAPLITIGLIAATIGLYPALASASGHTLVVDGVEYDSTHEAGDSIHWETPGSNPQEASFAERNQTWVYGDNGTDHLPCEFGVHWISNENVLTVSGCLEGTTTSTTTTLPDTTTTTSSTLAPTTTVGDGTTTSSTVAETTTTTQPALGSTTTSPATTASSTVAPTPPPNQPLPKTGSGGGVLPYAIVIVCLGALGVLIARRRVT